MFHHLNRLEEALAWGEAVAVRRPDDEVLMGTLATAAMDDDLNVSGALAVVHETVRAANTALDDADPDTAHELAASVVAMTGVLGVDPLDPHWQGGSGSGYGEAGTALDALVRRRLDEREVARTCLLYTSPSPRD